jgi:hypothetical protein
MAKEDTIHKGQPNGYAPLGPDTLVPSQFLPGGSYPSHPWVARISSDASYSIPLNTRIVEYGPATDGELILPDPALFTEGGVIYIYATVNSGSHSVSIKYGGSTLQTLTSTASSTKSYACMAQVYSGAWIVYFPFSNVAMLPLAHNSSHMNGGSDEIASTGYGVGVIPKTDAKGKLNIVTAPHPSVRYFGSASWNAGALQEFIVIDATGQTDFNCTINKFSYGQYLYFYVQSLASSGHTRIGNAHVSENLIYLLDGSSTWEIEFQLNQLLIFHVCADDDEAKYIRLIYDSHASVTPTSHQLDGALHSVSGLTTGQFLKALSATTFGFAAHGLTAADVGALATVTGTGFPHIIAGVLDAAAKLMDTADINDNQVTPVKLKGAFTLISGVTTYTILNTDQVLLIDGTGQASVTATLLAPASNVNKFLYVKTKAASNTYIMLSVADGGNHVIALSGAANSYIDFTTANRCSIFFCDGTDYYEIYADNFLMPLTVTNAMVASAAAILFSKLATTNTDVILGRLSALGGAVEEITCTAAGRALLDDANATAQRTTLGLGTAATHAEGDFASETDVTLGALIAASGAKATPIDADLVGIADTADTNKLKKTTWTQIKAFLKTYFDTLYAVIAGATIPSATTPQALGTAGANNAAAKVDHTHKTGVGFISNSAAVTIANTNVETDILTTTIPANLVTSFPSAFMVEMVATYQCTNTSGILTFRVYINNTVAAQTVVVPTQTSAAGPVWLWLKFPIRLRDSSVYLAFPYGRLALATPIDLFSAIADVATTNGWDPTAAGTFKITAQWATANAANSL